jgi:hypothetical protein
MTFLVSANLIILQDITPRPLLRPIRSDPGIFMNHMNERRERAYGLE